MIFRWIYCHSCFRGTVIQECSLKLIVIGNSHRDVFINNTVLNLWLKSEKYLLWSLVFSKFTCNVFLLLTTSAEKLCFITFCWTPILVDHPMKASVSWKAGENIRETFGIIGQVSSFNLKESSTLHLIFWNNKETKGKFLFDTLQSRKKNE